MERARAGALKAICVGDCRGNQDGCRPAGWRTTRPSGDLCLSQNHRSPTTYGRAGEVWEAGIVEATSMAGYYATLAMVMNTARAPSGGRTVAIGSVSK
jgi:hypothetical protein